MGKNEAVAVSIENLQVFLGNREIISGLNLTVQQGKFYSIIGPNGAGKTTLLRTIAGGLQPSQGRILIEGQDLAGLTNKERARKIAYVMQDTAIDFEFSVLDYVLMGRYPYLRVLQNEGTADLASARKAMEITNTWDLREQNINEISGGERQRVVVARALAQETPIVLLDEPVSQLDLYHQLELLDTLREMVTRYGATVVAVLHDLNLAAQYSDYLVLLNKGKIIKEGSPAEIITNEVLAPVYNLEVQVAQNPATGRPYIIPLRANQTASNMD